jgi:hypothetical protein
MSPNTNRKSERAFRAVSDDVIKIYSGMNP